MKNKKYYYIALCVIHLAIAFIAFLKFRMHPADIVFSNDGDGLKNTYTLISYVKAPITPEGIWKYNQMSYPFGDYAFFTDNTPVFAVPFRMFCHYVWDISDYTIIIFNLVVILNIVACGLLLFFVLSYLLNESLFSFIASV